jgi:hypothetical protein
MMIQKRTNLQFLHKSRKRLHAGDVFAMQLPDGRYLFGRVIGVALPRERAPMETANLLYVYDVLRATADVNPDELTRDRLLIAPVYTNRLGWVDGYFLSVAHRPLKPDDVLEQHCFWDTARERYIDEHENVLDAPVEPCGTWGLAHYHYIDDLISDALDIPRTPEEPGDG